MIDKYDLKVFAAVSLFNYAIPTLYYNISKDYNGNWNNTRNGDRNGRGRSVTDLQPRNRQTNNGNRNPRRNRGTYDDDVWEAISSEHQTLWGASIFFYVAHYFGWLESRYASYIKHWISNVAWIVYISNIITLALDATEAQDVQGFAELALYAITFAAAANYMELTHGVGAILVLDPDYEHKYDTLLLPSLAYYFGWIQHQEPQVKKLDPLTNDPTADTDTIINSDSFFAIA